MRDSIKCQIYLEGVTRMTIQAQLKDAYPAIADHVLNVVYSGNVLKVDNHSGLFPAGAQDTLATILEPYRKQAPVKMQPLTMAQRGKLNKLRLMKGWV